MSWSAHLTHTPTGLAITFAEPVSRLDLTPDVAEHFASLIAIEARARVAGVVRALEAENLGVFPSHHSGAMGKDGLSLARHGGAQGIVGNSNARHGVARFHPLCCDCDGCLNGGRDA